MLRTLSVELDHAWTEIAGALRQAVDERTYRLWLEPLRCEGLRGDTLVLTGPAEVAGWAADRLGRVLQVCAASVLGPQVIVDLSATGTACVPPAGGQAQSARRRAASISAPTGARATPQQDQDTDLNPRYTFEHFVIGTSNRLAHAAALAVAEMPAQAYNPLFIYGPPGLGKTHLLQSIGNYVRAFGGGLTVRYATAESYTSEFVAALAARSIDAFKDRFRRADVLLIDDIQFLERKVRTEEEFFHTFNALYESGSQLVLTCDRLPGDLDGLETRLRERFEAGLVTDIGHPDLATRLAILRRSAAHNLDRPADDAALRLLAEHITSNVRTLEGALIRVVAYASLRGQALTADAVAQVLGRLPARVGEPGSVSIADVQGAVCAHFQLSREQLVSRSRAARIAWARQAAMYLSRELTDHSLPAIAGEFGGRDHTTVLHAWRRAGSRIAADEAAFADIERITQRITGQD